MNRSTEHPKASEYLRGKEGLYACSDTALQECPRGMLIDWRQTTRPVTGPRFGTPAADAMSNGESVWEPVFGFDVTKRKAEEQAVRVKGEAALRRLLQVALRSTDQSCHVAAFLLSLYNGYRFPFNMTRLRAIDNSIWLDCIAVLALDARPALEVHEYFEDGAGIFEALAIKRGLV